MFGWFQKKKIITKEIDPFGSFCFRDCTWFGSIKIGDEQIEISLDGDKQGPSEFTINYLKYTADSLHDFWKMAIVFTQKSLLEKNVLIDISDSKFELLGISIHRESSFDNGHLVFLFDIQSDENGSYYVSFVNEKPSHLHRDN